MNDDIERLDRERWSSGEPSETGDLRREWSVDRTECRITYCFADASALSAIVAREVAAAERLGYQLEWKTYEHDQLSDLPVALRGAGFEAEPVEAVLVRTEPLVNPPRADAPAVRVVTDPDADLADLIAIWQATGRRGIDQAVDTLRVQLRECAVSVHIAYSGGEPASCGRLHYGTTPAFAELAGGSTVPGLRCHGLYTELVYSRLAEAFSRLRTAVYVDALPTSAPILRGRGFRHVTDTRPYSYTPASMP
ncbi:hypothetical protein [Nocardia sp. NPDC005745]|uniref:hypothetical protein n=1 Tax=Nocardia sp. NPDC005745 TaxID=3157061 RepID=UPI0033E6F583